MPRCDHLLVGSNDRRWRPAGDQLTVVHQRDAVAESFDRHQVVRDEEHRRSRTSQLVQPIDALQLKGGVADGQHFVDEQNVRLEMCGDGEAEPDVHPGGYHFTGVSMNSETPANSTIRSNLACSRSEANRRSS